MMNDQNESESLSAIFGHVQMKLSPVRSDEYSKQQTKKQTTKGDDDNERERERIERERLRQIFARTFFERIGGERAQCSLKAE